MRTAVPRRYLLCMWPVSAGIELVRSQHGRTQRALLLVNMPSGTHKAPPLIYMPSGTQRAPPLIDIIALWNSEGTAPDQHPLFSQTGNSLGIGFSATRLLENNTCTTQMSADRPRQPASNLPGRAF